MLQWPFISQASHMKRDIFRGGVSFALATLAMNSRSKRIMFSSVLLPFMNRHPETPFEADQNDRYLRIDFPTL